MKMMHGARALGLGEQVAHPAGADADEHLDEIGAGHAEEGDVGLAGDRLGQQRLAGAGRADQQHALGNPAAQGLILVRSLEEIDDLAQLGHGFVDAGHVREGGFQVFLGMELVPGAAEGQRRAAAPHPAQQQKPDQREHDNHRHQRNQALHDTDCLPQRGTNRRPIRSFSRLMQIGIARQADACAEMNHFGLGRISTLGRFLGTVRRRSR